MTFKLTESISTTKKRKKIETTQNLVFNVVGLKEAY